MTAYCIDWNKRKFYAYFRKRLYSVHFDDVNPDTLRILMKAVIHSPACVRQTTTDIRRWFYIRKEAAA